MGCINFIYIYIIKLQRFISNSAQEWPVTIFQSKTADHTFPWFISLFPPKYLFGHLHPYLPRINIFTDKYSTYKVISCGERGPLNLEKKSHKIQSQHPGKNGAISLRLLAYNSAGVLQGIYPIIKSHLLDITLDPFINKSSM